MAEEIHITQQGLPTRYADINATFASMQGVPSLASASASAPASAPITGSMPTRSASGMQHASYYFWNQPHRPNKPPAAPPAGVPPAGQCTLL